jgi:hypothetical protein
MLQFLLVFFVVMESGYVLFGSHKETWNGVS